VQRRAVHLKRRGAMWAPILDGPLGAWAVETVREIATALRVRPLAGPRGGNQDSAVPAADNASLAGGRGGLAIFYAYLARAGLADGASKAADEFLDEAVEALAKVSMPPSLYGGFTGVAWAGAHLRRVANAEADDDPNEEIDAALRQYLKRSPWTDDYDLVSGLVGLGVYALERLPRRSARDLLARVIRRLDETCQRTKAGFTWFTRPELLPDHQRKACPQGYYNFGVAHGVPGVIALLGCARAAGVAPATTGRLLDGSVRWLLSNRLPKDAGSTFPVWTAPGNEPRPARSAWCYGDPGIAAALLCAARGARSTLWRREALAIARRAAARPPDQAGVRDAGLCHGAAGLAHLFNRMHHATGDPELAEAARFWFARTLDMRQSGLGIAGFAAYRPRENGTADWADDAGLLTGAAGIALALLAATTPIEPAWDRMLLAS
jgi:lantibiotic modifying enzyme